MSATRWHRLSSLCRTAWPFGGELRVEPKGCATAPGWRPCRKGFFLLEVLLSVAILLLILGGLTAAANSVRGGLQQALRNEVWAEEWARLAELLRDDLRRARAVTWHVAAPTASPWLFLTVRLPGGAQVLYESLERRIERCVMEGGKVTARQRFEGALSAAELKRSAVLTPADPGLGNGAGNAGVWDLVSFQEQETLDILNAPVYLQARLELDSGLSPRGKTASARPVRTLLVGAATRLERVGEGRP